MKILILVDSFKGSLSSFEAGCLIKNYLKKYTQSLNIEAIPIADGGEGTTEAIIEKKKGRYISINAQDPIDRTIKVKYGLLNNSTAVIDVASVSGITLVKQEELDPWITSSYGLGQVIKDALEKGCKKIIIGLGGSATNECGLGMLNALGVKFYDKTRRVVNPKLINLSKIVSFDTSVLNMLIGNVEFEILVDVKNPFCGENGATKTYGKQKGLLPDEENKVDEMFNNFANVVERQLNVNKKEVEGAGAAGGIGFALLAFTGAKIHQGINYLIELFEIEKIISQYDLVITGEGKLDRQTLNNKLPIGISKLAKKHNKEIICLAGIIEKAEELNIHFDGIFSLVDSEKDIEKSMTNPKPFFERAIKRIVEEYIKK